MSAVNVKITQDYARSLLPKRPEDSNKATFGNVLNVAGSYSYRGAACLSSAAALRVGAGYVTFAGIEKVADAVNAFVPDAVLCPLREKSGSIAPEEAPRVLSLVPRATVVSIGCGLTCLGYPHTDVLAFFNAVMNGLSRLFVPVVLDADGLNLFSEAPGVELQNMVMTPHPKELSRLLKLDVAAIQADRASAVIAAADKFHATVVLKGHVTLVSDGRTVFENTTGCSALAKAGAGDVLTGIISGLCAQGLSVTDAACLGVYLHGLAGDLAAQDLTEYGVLASDLLKYIPRAIAATF